MNPILARAVLSLGLAGLVLAAPAQVAASCIAPPPLGEAIGDAGLVFVGAVTAVANEGRWATVTVDEIWKGPELPPIVEVRGGEEPGTFSSVDRSYEAGVRYLFVVGGAAGGHIRDSACSSTTAWSDGLARHRPADARPPVGQQPSEPGSLDVVPIGLALGGVGAVGLVLFGLVALVGRRRS